MIHLLFLLSVPKGYFQAQYLHGCGRAFMTTSNHTLNTNMSDIREGLFEFSYYWSEEEAGQVFKLHSFQIWFLWNLTEMSSFYIFWLWDCLHIATGNENILLLLGLDMN